MKKSVFLIAFLLIGFLCFGQNERPYVIKYKTQSDTIYHHTQSVSGIHIDASGQELIHEDGTDWSSLTDLDTVYIYRSDIVNPSYVPIDWNEASLVSSNDSIGDYQIQFNGEIPELQPGSVITIDQDTVVHYIFVESVDVNGNMVSVTSTEAYLTDIFADVDFTLTTDEGGKSSAQGNVFYPVAAFIQDEQGVFSALDLERSRDWGFTHDLWQFGANYDGEVLSSGNNYSIYMERMNFNFDLDIEMYMNFSGRDVFGIVGNLIERYRSRALNVNAALHGSFDTEQMLRCDIWGSCSWNPGYDIWKHNLFPPLTVRFLVYGVPVILKLNSDLYREVQVTAGGEISAYTGFTDNADGRIGFEWSQSSGISPVATFSNTFDLTPPTVEGRGSIQGKVWAFPRVRILLYDIVGPSFDFKPYLTTTLSGGFKEELLGQSNDFCAWSLDCNTGLDAACGLSIMHPIFSGYEIQHYSSPNWNIIDRPLYHSPKRIQKVSLEGSGQTKTATFNLFDQNYLFNMEVLTPLWQFVKFEADGQLSSEYGIARNGQVTVNWTPTSNDVLYAKLYDINGNVMSWDTIHAPETPEPQGDWVDLGLPSGLLWATRNVGASSPEDYGDYFAWAETQPKSEYNWSTYQYTCNNDCDGLTKYCDVSDSGCDGFTDNLTILQSDDDAATVNWGDGARMPTMEEWEELYYNCTYVLWITQNGVHGTLFVGPNGNMLFLPAAGYRWDSELIGTENCYYWSSSLAWESHAFRIQLVGGTYMDDFDDRCYGLSVRAVREN
jgi:hypothetical protein